MELSRAKASRSTFGSQVEAWVRRTGGTCAGHEGTRCSCPIAPRPSSHWTCAAGLQRPREYQPIRRARGERRSTRAGRSAPKRRACANACPQRRWKTSPPPRRAIYTPAHGPDDAAPRRPHACAVSAALEKNALAPSLSSGGPSARAKPHVPREQSRHRRGACAHVRGRLITLVPACMTSQAAGFCGPLESDDSEGMGLPRK